MSIHKNVFKFFKAMRTKSFHVCLTMKVTLLLQVQKIIHAKYGEILKFMERKRNDLNLLKAIIDFIDILEKEMIFLCNLFVGFIIVFTKNHLNKN